MATPIIFTSKFQEFKRPQIFVQGAVGFLRAQPDYLGSILLVCGDLDTEYAKHVLGLIPGELQPRFQILSNISPSRRDDIVSTSIAAFPSTYESFCLAAYESAFLGGLVLLNSTNPAFGDDTPWKDGVNCLKFDGSAHGLMAAMQRAVSLAHSLDTVTLPPLEEPWSMIEQVSEAAPSGVVSEPLVSVILVNQNQGLLAADSLESVAIQGYSNLEIIYVDDNSGDSASAVLVEHIEATGTQALSVVRQPTTAGVAASRNWATDQAHGDFVLFINAGDLLAEGYIRKAVSALSHAPQYDIYVSQCGVYDNIDDTMAPDLLTVETFAGEAPISGSVINYYSEGPRMCRKRIASRIRYRPHLGGLYDWGWMHDAVSEGARVIASPQTDALMRNLAATDLAEPIDDRHRLHHLLIASSPAAERMFPIAALAQVVHGSGLGASASKLPPWQLHMNENGYEEEVEFVASVLGRTRLGHIIRTNKSISRVLEVSIRWLSGLK